MQKWFPSLGHWTVVFETSQGASIPILKEQYLCCEGNLVENMEGGILKMIHDPGVIPGMVCVGKFRPVTQEDGHSLECGLGKRCRQKDHLELKDQHVSFMAIKKPYDALVAIWDLLESDTFCHVPCHFFIFPFIFICSHSFPLFISIFCYSFSFSVHSLVLDSSAHVSGLLSMLWVPYISCVLVLDHSGLIITCTVSLFWQFTLATISYGAPSVITCSLLLCSGLVQPSPFTCICFHLLLVVISPLLFRQLCLLPSSPVFGST